MLKLADWRHGWSHECTHTHHHHRHHHHKPGLGLLESESCSITRECRSSHLLCFDNSLMKKKPSSLVLLVRITHAHPAIAFHSHSISECGSRNKLTNWAPQILTPCAEIKIHWPRGIRRERRRVEVEERRNETEGKWS